jgi:NADH:ubiquinone oxidoreductase subunit 3 (subunit A)
MLRRKFALRKFLRELRSHENSVCAFYRCRNFVSNDSSLSIPRFAVVARIFTAFDVGNPFLVPVSRDVQNSTTISAIFVTGLQHFVIRLLFPLTDISHGLILRFAELGECGSAELV